MPSQITHISVFLASPSDVLEERNAVRQVIDELNSIVRQTSNIHLDIIGWETHAYPSVGIDAQDVINNQIGDDYDIFIGIMWKKFSSPTGRAGSGTEEEFLRAYDRFKNDKVNPKIMMYFSSKAIQPDDIDLDQMAKVKSFKGKAQELGVLHWTFVDIDSFQKILKIHLTKHVLEIQSKIHNSIQLLKNNEENISGNVLEGKEIDEDEEGIFDLMEIFSDNMPEVERVLLRLAGHMEELGGRLNEKTSRIESLNKSPKRSPNSYRLLLDRVADDIMNYVDMTNIDLPKYHDLFSKSIDALSNALALAEANGQNIDREELVELSDALIDVKDIIKNTVGSMVFFRESGSSFPPMAKSVTKASRLLNKAATNVIEELNISEGLLEGLHEVVNSILARKDGESGVEEI
ncbi:hypothetical protein [Hymenobacter sp. APR13]|uniref:hypothetical protein n=1 Tax=Hymenobacter sp. APR13 TaxID=1356852 RepID=UPI000AB1DF6C|nr:hypothetical protein [Hymenobacter sp. APR13]